MGGRLQPSLPLARQIYLVYSGCVFPLNLQTLFSLLSFLAGRWRGEVVHSWVGGSPWARKRAVRSRAKYLRLFPIRCLDNTKHTERIYWQPWQFPGTCCTQGQNGSWLPAEPYTSAAEGTRMNWASSRKIPYSFPFPLAGWEKPSKLSVASRRVRMTRPCCWAARHASGRRKLLTGKTHLPDEKPTTFVSLCLFLLQLSFSCQPSCLKTAK